MDVLQVTHVRTGKNEGLNDLLRVEAPFIVLQAKPKARWNKWDHTVTARKGLPVTELIMLSNGCGEQARGEGSTFLADPEHNVWYEVRAGETLFRRSQGIFQYRHMDKTGQHPEYNLTDTVVNVIAEMRSIGYQFE